MSVRVAGASGETGRKAPGVRCVSAAATGRQKCPGGQIAQSASCWRCPKTPDGQSALSASCRRRHRSPGGRHPACRGCKPPVSSVSRLQEPGVGREGQKGARDPQAPDVPSWSDAWKCAIPTGIVKRTVRNPARVRLHVPGVGPVAPAESRRWACPGCMHPALGGSGLQAPGVGRDPAAGARRWAGPGCRRPALGVTRLHAPGVGRVRAAGVRRWA
jgi:hypothetical protein